MNNLFKSNSRFAALADETDNKKKDDKKKDDKKKDNNNNNKQKEDKQNDNNRFKEEKEINNRFKGAFEPVESKEVKKEVLRERNQFQRQEIIQKVEPIVESKPLIQADDFSSSLSKSTTTTTATNATAEKPALTFAERAAKNCNIGEIIRFTPIEKPRVKEVLDEETIEKIKEQQMAYEVLDALCDLHERRTAMYIERYGYDAWERTFKFKGWEEEEAYNQKLDDDYEDWLEKEEEREYKEEEARYREEEYLANNDRYVNYWKYY